MKIKYRVLGKLIFGRNSRSQEITSSGEELDEQDKTFLVTAYRYMMSYNYQVLKDKKAALDYATKMLELKPDDEGIRQAVESLSK